MIKHFDILFVPGNDVFAISGVQSTARFGSKWYDQACPNDILVLRLIDPDLPQHHAKYLGRAVIVKTELTTRANVLATAHDNHAVLGLGDEPNVTPRQWLDDALLRAYGPQAEDEPYTKIHFVIIPDEAFLDL